MNSYGGCRPGPLELFAWSDLRHEDMPAGGPIQIWGCLLSEQALELALAGGWSLECCAGPAEEALTVQILAHLDDPDVFGHYASLKNIMTGLNSPQQAVPALAQLCLLARWPLAENAWLVLEPLLNQHANPTAAQLLRLYLVSTPQLSSALRPSLEIDMAEPGAWERWRTTWELAWSSPWATDDDSSWAMSVSHQLLWETSWEARIPLQFWLPLALSERLERVDSMLALLRRRSTELLLYDPKALRVLEELVEVGLQPWLQSCDKSIIHRCLRLFGMFRPRRDETFQLLLGLSQELPLEIREDALWLAFQNWLEWDLRRTVLEHPNFPMRYRVALATSPDPESDWQGYLNEQDCEWLIDPNTLENDLGSSDPEILSKARLWQATMPVARLAELLRLGNRQRQHGLQERNPD
jgi:hypothetical protein